MHENSMEAYALGRQRMGRRTQLVLDVFRLEWENHGRGLTARQCLERARRIDHNVPYDLNSVRPRITGLCSTVREAQRSGSAVPAGLVECGTVRDSVSGKKVAVWRYSAPATEGAQLALFA